MRTIAVFLFSLISLPGISSGFELCELFTDNAVLQREMPVPVWGWAEPGSVVTVEFAGQKIRVTTNTEGEWAATLKPLQLNKVGQEMIVSSPDKKRVLSNILVGDVWLCGGQSNMAMTFETKRMPCDLPDFVKPADYPNIRHLAVGPVRMKKPPAELMHVPQTKLQPGQIAAGWEVSDANTYKNFSAAAFFFAYSLSNELDIPIGLLNCTQGNTRIGSWVSPKNVEKFADKMPEKHPFRAVYSSVPCTNYNTQIAPVAGFAIKGALWYQGEANGKEGDSYYWKMKALIEGWREVWQQGDFPFYFAQLPSYDGKRAWWPPIREAQRKALSIPGTGMAVLTDVGDNGAEFPINLHPRNKYEVGRRLALWALAKDYGKEDLIYSGPLFKSAAFKGGKAIISFDHVGGGLMAAKKSSARSVEPPSPVGNLEGFEIAGADKKWFTADAEIKGDQVILSSKELSKPVVAVRYLYTLNTDHGTLYNKAGLPASPFRTDDWPK